MLSSYGLFIGDKNDKSDSEIMVNPQLKELVQFICGHPHLLNVVSLRYALQDQVYQMQNHVSTH